jgi:hypothetical protein
MKSRGVSLSPPLPALVRGVRTASVITTSSGFFCVLEKGLSACEKQLGQSMAYMADKPDFVGVRWLNIEFSLSAAITYLRFYLLPKMKPVMLNPRRYEEEKAQECGEESSAIPTTIFKPRQLLMLRLT